MDKPEKVIVVSPLSSIMKEQVEKLSKLSVTAVQLNQKCKVAGLEKGDGTYLNLTFPLIPTSVLCIGDGSRSVITIDLENTCLNDC